MYKIAIEFLSKGNVTKKNIVGLLKRCFSIEKIYFIEKSRKVFMTLNFLPDAEQLEYMLCPIGLEDKKLLLFDNFVCWDEGEYIGEVSADVIKRMRKCN